MNILRTPDERFDNLPGYPFQPHYSDVDDQLRMHYVDEGENPDETVLMLHGEPSWSYLYRKMIPVVSNAGYRVIAPDLIGFGRSDKPADRKAYSYQSHMDWLEQLIKNLDLKNITLVCQDWGGLLGLRMAAENPDRFKRIVVANTTLPTGDLKAPLIFKIWQFYAQMIPRFNAGRIVALGCVNKPTPEVRAAYNAPYPDESYKAGARMFPKLVPIRPDDPASDANRAAWEVLKNWEKPLLTAFSDSDPIMRGLDKYFRKVVPGAQGQAHTTIKKAGHFLQEDKGEELAAVVVKFIQANP